MYDMNREEIAEQAREIAPISPEDIEQLVNLVNGVREAADRLRDVVPDFPNELDGGILSRTVDGEK